MCRIKVISKCNKQYIVPAFHTCNLGSISYGGNFLWFWYEIWYSKLGITEDSKFAPGIAVSSCIKTYISNLNQDLSCNTVRNCITLNLLALHYLNILNAINNILVFSPMCPFDSIRLTTILYDCENMLSNFVTIVTKFKRPQFHTNRLPRHILPTP